MISPFWITNIYVNCYIYTSTEKVLYKYTYIFTYLLQSSVSAEIGWRREYFYLRQSVQSSVFSPLSFKVFNYLDFGCRLCHLSSIRRQVSVSVGRSRPHPVLILALHMCACGLFVLFVFAYLSDLFFPSSFFRLTFSSISSSISYLPEYGPAPFPGRRS